MDLSTPEGFRAELSRLEEESKHRRASLEDIGRVKERLVKGIQQAERELHRMRHQCDATIAEASIATWDLEKLHKGDGRSSTKAALEELASAIVRHNEQRETFRRALRDIAVSRPQ